MHDSHGRRPCEPAEVLGVIDMAHEQSPELVVDERELRAHLLVR
jgi:hypothetical protein